MAAGSWRAAFGPWKVNVRGVGGGAGGTGGRWFWVLDGGSKDVIVGVGEEVAEASTSVEGGVQGAGEDGFFDASG